MNNSKKIKPWVYKNILDIIDLDPKTALERNVDILSIQISQNLYNKLTTYLGENRLKTFMNFGRGGKYDGGNYYTYSINFKITHNREKDKFYINKGGTRGYTPKDNDIGFKNPYGPKNYETLKKLTPTMLQLFYGFLKKYPEHILNVNWRYSEDDKGIENLFEEDTHKSENKESVGFYNPFGKNRIIETDNNSQQPKGFKSPFLRK